MFHLPRAGIEIGVPCSIGGLRKSSASAPFNFINSRKCIFQLFDMRKKPCLFSAILFETKDDVLHRVFPNDNLK